MLQDSQYVITKIVAVLMIVLGIVVALFGSKLSSLGK